MKRNQDFEMVMGDSKTLAFTILDADGDAQNLATAGVGMKVRDSDGNLKLTRTSNDDTISITNAASGLLEVYIRRGETTGWDAGEYPYDLEVAIGTRTQTVANGKLYLFEEQTKV